MTKITQFTTVALVGVAAGLLGGLFAASIFVRWERAPKQPDVVRAKMFEAIGDDGRVRARFGLDSGDLPIMTFLGPDQKERFIVMLDNVDEPTIMMKDINGNIRAYFGHDTSDTASPSDDDWSVSFQAPGDDDRLAVLGMIRSYPSRKHRGVAAVRDVRGKWFSLRPE